MKELIKCNNNCYSIASKILNTRTGEPFNLLNLEYLSLFICFRMIHSLKALNNLLPFIADAGYYSSIALVLRPSLLDLITYGYITDNIEVKDGKVIIPNEIIESLYIDNISRHISEVNLQKTHGSISHRELVKRANDIKKIGGMFFKTFTVNANKIDFTFNNQLKFPTPRVIYKKLKESDSPIANNIANAYLNYSRYSKFEHFGFLTIHLTRADEKVFKEHVISSNIYILKGVQATLAYLGYLESGIENEIENLIVNSPYNLNS